MLSAVRKTGLFALLALVLLSYAPPAFSGVDQLSEAEFRALASELAPRVNLFRDAWAQDPSAEFYGGTSRDYLYWLKGKFREAKTRGEAERVREELRARPLIDVREFIIGESDIDILSDRVKVNAADYGIKKIDVSNNQLRENTAEVLADEVNQGFVPAEKIRLSRAGFYQPKELGDGVGEIYRGRLTVKFPDLKEFARTKYAREGLNHPILLALRYVRLQAMDYFQSHGAGAPDRVALFAGIDEGTQAKIRALVIEVADGKALKPYLEKERFKSFLNGSVQKAFRSYTNPTAARELYREFGLDVLPIAYAKSVDPINQYLFAKSRDPEKIVAAFAKAGVKPEEIYQSPQKFFPDGKIYHGTRTEQAFRNVLFQGILPSEGGSAGKGLYAVAAKDKSFSETWGGGTKEVLVSFPVKPDAKIIDISTGPGARLWEKFGGRDHEAFADAYGADILKYPYQPEAYVVKNSASLGRGAGVYREILTLSEIMERVAAHPEDFFPIVSLNRLTGRELITAAELAKIDRAKVLSELKRSEHRELAINLAAAQSEWKHDPEIHQAVVAHSQSRRTFVQKFVVPEGSKVDPALLDRALSEGWADDLIVRSPGVFDGPTGSARAMALSKRLRACASLLGRWKKSNNCESWEHRAADLLRTLASRAEDHLAGEVKSLSTALLKSGSYGQVVSALMDTPHRTQLLRIIDEGGKLGEEIRVNVANLLHHQKDPTFAREFYARPFRHTDFYPLLNLPSLPLEEKVRIVNAALPSLDGEAVADAARSLLDSKWGDARSAWMDLLFERSDRLGEYFYGALLDNASFSDAQKRLWLQKAAASGNHDVGLLVYALDKEPWSREVGLLQEILDRGRADGYFITFALGRQPHARPDWFRTLLKRGFLDDMMILALDDPKWAAHPELLYPFFEPAYLSKKRLGYLNRVLKESHWQTNPELLRLTGGKPPTAENLRLALHGKGLAASWSGIKSDCGRFFARIGKGK